MSMLRVDSPEARRLRLALDMFSTGVAMMRATLGRRYPQATEAEIEARLSAWLQQRPGAEQGDAIGTPSHRAYSE